jgi:rubredoxin
MVEATERDGTTWYQCENCGLLFDDESDAGQHEDNCAGDDPSYLQ